MKRTDIIKSRARRYSAVSGPCGPIGWANPLTAEYVQARLIHPPRVRTPHAIAVAMLLCVAAGPATRDAADDILGLSAPAPPHPTTEPATRPSVFKPAADDGETRDGAVTLSDGTVLAGKIATTAEKPIRIWVEQEKQYEDVPLSQVARAQVQVTWERDEPEWNFKESGSDVKVYSGRTYPAREQTYKFTLTDGTVIAGGVVAPLYVTTADGKSRTLVLHKRDKGTIGQKLADVVYVKTVELK